jgi:GT2 family glycosyltransferase
MTRTTTPRVSIVIPSFNTRDTTLACLDRIRAHTPAPAEVIVVDNGSRDGSADAVAALVDDGHPVAVRLLRNAENQGYARGTNQGLRVARGHWLVLLNSDVLVTPRWTARLIANAEQPHVGLVGPMTNYAGSAAQGLVAPPRYRDVASLDAFAQRWAQAHHHEATSVERLIGFCIVVRRRVLDRIGLLDERFEVGNYEDDDLCRRALAAGYLLVVARDVYVHHEGSLTFRVNSIDQRACLAENAIRFAEKWRGPAQPPPRTRGRLSLCMIVRDEAATLGRCLASAAPAVDEIVVVDTGSQDDTVAVAVAHGARVLHAAWTDDFAAARNIALDAARGDWVLSLDADEELPPATAAALPALVASCKAPGMLVPIQNRNLRGGIESMHQAVRLFRRLPEHRWTGTIHEGVRVKGPTVTTVPIVHHGYVDPATVRGKLERNLHLLDRELVARPGDATLHYYRSMTLRGLGDGPRAADAAEATLRHLGNVTPSGRALAFEALAKARFLAGDLAAAEAAALAALAALPDWIDPLLLLGRIARRMHRPTDAIVHLGRYFAARERLAVDPTFAARFGRLGTFGNEATARAELAAVYGSLGNNLRARQEAARAAALAPDDPEIARLLAEATSVPDCALEVPA